MNPDHVPLDRKFIALSPDEKPSEEHDLSRYLHRGISWADLLSQAVSVILAGADSGKTWELQWKAEELRQLGHEAFFIKLEDLVDGNPSTSMSPDDFSAIETWKAGSEQAWFFLDSVDEAKIKSQAAFRQALFTFANLIGANLERIAVVISSRPAAWEPNVDNHLVEKIFRQCAKSNPSVSLPKELSQDELFLGPIRHSGRGQLPDDAQFDVVSETVDKESTKQSVCNVYILADLDEHAQRDLASAWDVPEVDKLLAAAFDQRLESFALRPGDWKDLCLQWKMHGALGTRNNMMRARLENVIVEKRKGGELSDERAWAGATRLAAALLLAKANAILPDGSQVDLDDAIRASEVLWDWTSDEREQLLLRGLFAQGFVGRVQFRNRSWVDYLAADWFRSILKTRQACRPEIEDLLFKTVWGEETVCPEVELAACWLATDHEWVRAELLTRKPKLLMSGGDPTYHPVEFKAQLLMQWARLHKEGRLGRQWLEGRDYAAFSDPELAEPLREAWQENQLHEFRLDLCELIAKGKLHDCVDLVRSLLDPKLGRLTTKFVVCEALNELDDAEGLQQAADYLRTGEYSAKDGLYHRIIPLLYPVFLTTDDVLALLAELPKPKYRNDHNAGMLIGHVVQNCPSSELDLLCKGLVDLIETEPAETGYRKLSANHGFLANAFMQSVPTLITRFSSPENSKPLLRFLMHAQQNSEDYKFREDFNQASEMVNARSELKRALFWEDMEATTSKMGEIERRKRLDLLSYWRMHETLWNLQTDDIPWMEEACRSETQGMRRAAVGSCLIAFYDREGILSQNVDRIRSLIKWNEGLRAMLDKYVAPKKVPKWKQREKSAERRRLAMLAINERDWLNYRRDLQRRLPGNQLTGDIKRDADILRFRSALSRWLSWPSEHRKSLGPRGWKSLAPAWGQSIAEAYRDLFLNEWLRVKPQRPKRAGTTTTYKWDVIYGFASVGVAADLNPSWHSSLTQEQAKRAIRYAIWTDRGIPDWLGGLEERFPDELLLELRKELKREWTTDEPLHKRWIEYVSRKEGPEDTMLTALVSVMVNNNAPDGATFRQGARAIKGRELTDKSRSQLLRLANKLLLNANDVEDRMNALSLWASVDLEEAGVALARTMSNISGDECQNLVCSFFKSHSSESIDLSNLSLNAICTILDQFGNKVPALQDVFEDQINSLRYSAQECRGSLIGAIRERPSHLAYIALRELAQREEICRHPRWLLSTAREMAEKASSEQKWTSKQIRQLESDGISPLSSSGALSKEVLASLEGIRRDFVNEDASSQRLLKLAPDESYVQEWLCEQLQLRFRGQVTAIREAEVADRKKPDLIAFSSLAEAEVVIELKHANMGYSVRDLEDTLEKQIVGRYLRVDRRCHGILFLSLHKDRTWRPKKGEIWDFEKTLDHLGAIADKISEEHSRDLTLTVFGLDAR